MVIQNTNGPVARHMYEWTFKESINDSNKPFLPTYKCVVNKNDSVDTDMPCRSTNEKDCHQSKSIINSTLLEMSFYNLFFII